MTDPISPPNDPTLDRAIAAQDAIISRVLKLVRTSRRASGRLRSKTLRQAIERDIRRAFDYHSIWCPHCADFLPELEFTIDRSRACGRRTLCKYHDKLQRQEHYWEDPEYHRAAARASLLRRGVHKTARKSVDYTPKGKPRRARA